MSQDVLPSAPINPSPSGEVPLVVGLDLGGTKMAAALVDIDGTLQGPVASCPTPAHDGPAVMLEAISALVQKVVTAGTHRAPGAAVSIVAVGIGTAPSPGGPARGSPPACGSGSRPRGWVRCRSTSRTTSTPTPLVRHGSAPVPAPRSSSWWRWVPESAVPSLSRGEPVGVPITWPARSVTCLSPARRANPAHAAGRGTSRA